MIYINQLHLLPIYHFALTEMLIFHQILLHHHQ